MKRLIVLLVALGALAGAAAGCGGGGGGAQLPKAEYEAKLQALQQDLASFGEELAKANDPGSLGQAIDKAANLLDEAAATLDDLNAPDEIADAHDQLVEGARQAADQFRDLAEKIRGTKPEDLLNVLRELNPANLEGVKKIQDGVDEIRSKGYRIGTQP